MLGRELQYGGRVSCEDDWKGAGGLPPALFLSDNLHRAPRPRGVPDDSDRGELGAWILVADLAVLWPVPPNDSLFQATSEPRDRRHWGSCVSAGMSRSPGTARHIVFRRWVRPKTRGFSLPSEPLLFHAAERVQDDHCDTGTRIAATKLLDPFRGSRSEKNPLDRL